MTRTPRAGALLGVVFLSGFAALAYQLLWMRELGLLLGATATAVATTLAVFFTGIAAGGWAVGRWVSGARRPLRWYAWLELGVAVSAVAYFVLLDAYDAAYRGLYPLVADSQVTLLAIKLAVAFLVLFPPAFCMGGTLPVLAEFLVRDRASFGRHSALLYGVNTAGAAAGAFVTGFVLPAMIGFSLAYWIAITASLAVFVWTFWLSRGERVEPPPVPVDSSDEHPPGDAPALAQLVFFSGFAALGLEVLWTQMFVQVLQNSVYTFACILVTFLLALAAGAWLAMRLMRFKYATPRVLAVLCATTGVSVALSTPFFYGLTDGLGYLGGQSGFVAYVASVFFAAGAAIGVPAVLLGAVFPFVFRACERGLVRPGRTLGGLIGINTMGAVLGSLFAGFVVLETVGLWVGIWLFGFGYVAFGVRLAGIAWLRERWLPASLVCAVAIGLFPFALPLVKLRSDETLVSLQSGATAITAVIDSPRARRIKVNNYYTLGGTGARVGEELQSHVPLALHGAPRSVCFLGLGTGITAGGALPFPVERVVVCELYADVVTASRDHFARYTRGLFGDERVEVRIEDGRQYLRASDATFDVIIADMFIPWRKGVGGMYTVEHFTAARDRLAEGGVFAQWLAAYQVTEREFGIVARTMLEVFPRVTLWRGGFAANGAAIALVGHQNLRPFDRDRVAANLAGLGRDDDVPLTAAALLEFYCADLTSIRGRFRSMPVNDDDSALIEYGSPRTHRAARAGDVKWLSGARLVDLLESLMESSRRVGRGT